MGLSQASIGQLLVPVDDLDAVHGTLVSRGVSFPAAPHLVRRTPTSELWLAEFRDPDGNPLALMSEASTTRAPG